jgi:prolipoprotein diacylglyceryltransferase
MYTVLAALPAPPGNSIHIGSFQLRAYGLFIALGVVAAVWIAQRRWQARGHDPADITAIALWAVPAGIVGSRIYHVITDLQRFEGRWLHIFAIWEGGLGIPGGIAAGVGCPLTLAVRPEGLSPRCRSRAAPARPSCRPLSARSVTRWP